MAAVIALAACNKEQSAEQPGTVAKQTPLEAELKNKEGQSVGRLRVSEDPNGVMLRVTVSGLSPGTHGMHVHAVGRCDVPGFLTAGPHWNPIDAQHGRDNPRGAHLGDLANIEVGPDGRAESAFQIAAARLEAGNQPMLDIDGASLVIHARPDDYRTDPDGTSGARIACAVIAG